MEVLEFDAESDTLRQTASYRHPPEIWHIASCPEDSLRLITVFNDGRTCISLPNEHSATVCGSKPHQLCQRQTIEQLAE